MVSMDVVGSSHCSAVIFFFLTRSAIENTHATRRDAPRKFFGRVLRLKTRARRATSKGKMRRWDLVSIKRWAVGHGKYRYSDFF